MSVKLYFQTIFPKSLDPLKFQLPFYLCIYDCLDKNTHNFSITKTTNLSLGRIWARREREERREDSDHPDSHSNFSLNDLIILSFSDPGTSSKKNWKKKRFLFLFNFLVWLSVSALMAVGHWPGNGKSAISVEIIQTKIF
jgi:hypothetical protein